MTEEHSGAAASQLEPSITNHVLRIAHAHYPYFVTQMVHLSPPSSSPTTSAWGGSSLFVHCFSLSPTDARTLLLHSAQSEHTHPVPLGNLCADFALAMPPSSTLSAYTRHPIATAISTTNSAAATSSLAAAMSKRIATKLAIPQLLLSLDLPPALLPTPGRIASPEDSRALLALEKALRDACASTLASSMHTNPAPTPIQCNVAT